MSFPLFYDVVDSLFMILNRISRKRESLIISAFPLIPPILKNKYSIHVILSSTVIYTIIQVFLITRQLTLFAFHPILLSLGLFIFFAEGLLVNKNERMLVEFLAPIMSGRRHKKTRTLHWMLQMAGTIFVGLGISFIVMHKIELGKSIVPMSLHSLIGSLGLIFILFQVFSGNRKVEALEESNIKIYSWHGDIGLLTLDVMMTASILGVIKFLDSFGTVFLMSLSWLTIHACFHMSSMNPKANDDVSIETNSIEEQL